MVIAKKLSSDEFRQIIKDKLINISGDVVDVSYWEFNINVDEDFCIKINFRDAWNIYNITSNIDVLLDFMNTQSNILTDLNNRQKSYLDISALLLPTIRSDDYLEKLKLDNTIKKSIGKNLNAVVVIDQLRYTQIINKDLYTNLPDDATILHQARENLLKKGWTSETQKYSEGLYELLVYEEEKYNTHYQFFIKEWMESHLGNCFFAFPTHKIALVMKIHTKDQIDYIHFLKQLVRTTFIEEPFPLSTKLIKYTDGIYTVL